MTDREALVERVAEALHGVLHGRFIPTFYEGEEALLLAARAALAVIEATPPASQSVAEARREVMRHFTGNEDEEYDGPCPELDALIEAVRAEERAPTQEAADA